MSAHCGACSIGWTKNPGAGPATSSEIEATACGVAPVALLLATQEAIRGEDVFQETLAYETSGDIIGDYQHSVSDGVAVGYWVLENVIGSGGRCPSCGTAVPGRWFICYVEDWRGSGRRGRPSYLRRPKFSRLNGQVRAR